MTRVVVISYNQIVSLHRLTRPDYWVELKSNVNTFLLKTSREHFHFELTHVINIQQQWEKNTKTHPLSTNQGFYLILKTH